MYHNFDKTFEKKLQATLAAFLMGILPELGDDISILFSIIFPGKYNIFQEILAKDRVVFCKDRQL